MEPPTLLARLFAQHALRLRRHLLRKTADPELAADLVQETFLRLARHGDKEVQQPSYLFKVANNLLIDHHRQSVFRQTESVANEQLDTLIDANAQPEQQALDQLQLERIKMHLERLTPRRRQVFLLCKLEGWTYEEVAEQLGISASSVHKDLSLALAHMASYQGDEQHERGVTRQTKP